MCKSHIFLILPLFSKPLLPEIPSTHLCSQIKIRALCLQSSAKYQIFSGYNSLFDYLRCHPGCHKVLSINPKGNKKDNGTTGFMRTSRKSHLSHCLSWHFCSVWVLVHLAPPFYSFCLCRDPSLLPIYLNFLLVRLPSKLCSLHGLPEDWLSFLSLSFLFDFIKI